MLNFFDSVISFFETIINMITQFFSSMFLALQFISSSVTYTALMGSYLPTVIGSCLIIVVALGVLKFILGR